MNLILLSFYIKIVFVCFIFILVYSYVVIYYVKKYNELNIMELEIIRTMRLLLPFWCLILSIIPILNIMWAMDGILTLFSRNRMEKSINVVLNGIKKY